MSILATSPLKASYLATATTKLESSGHPWKTAAGKRKKRDLTKVTSRSTGKSAQPLALARKKIDLGIRIRME